MKDVISHFDVEEKTYPLAFTLNVLAEIQKEIWLIRRMGQSY